MIYTISFYTDFFELESEIENSINPIRGVSVGEWLNPILEDGGIEVSAVDEEDWGWYSYATLGSQNYLIGYIGLPGEGLNGRAEIIIQLSKERTLIEKLFGRNRMSPDDPLIVTVSRIIRNNDRFNDVEEQFQK